MSLSFIQGINDEGIISSCERAGQDQPKADSDRYEFQVREPAKQIEISYDESVLSDGNSSLDVLDHKDDEVKVEFQANGGGKSSTYETSESSFSGFSCSQTGSDSSDDLSVCESISSSDSEKPDEPISADMLETTTSSSVKNLDQTKSISPKFACLVNSVEKFSESNKLNQPTCSSEEGQDKSSSSSGLGSNANACAASSDFWGRTLESKIDDDHDDHTLVNANAAKNSKLPNYESSLHFSFNLSSSSPLSTKQLELKDASSDDAYSIDSVSNKPNSEEKIKINATEGKISPSLSKQLSDSRAVKSLEVNFPPVSSVGGDLGGSDTSFLTNLSSDESNQRDMNASSSLTLKAKEYKFSSPNTSKHPLSACDSARSVPSETCRKVDHVQTISTCSTNCSNGKNGLKNSIWKAVDQFRGSKLSKQCTSGLGSETGGSYTDKVFIRFLSSISLIYGQGYFILN